MVSLLQITRQALNPNHFDKKVMAFWGPYLAFVAIIWNGSAEKVEDLSIYQRKIMKILL